MFRSLNRMLVLALALGASALWAQDAPLTLKLGTLAPDGSTWFNILQDMGQQWSAEGIHLQMYPGGELGDEPDMVNKMRINQIQMGVFTVVGLSQIDKGVQALSIPMLYKDDAESDYVRKKLQPALEKRLLAKGFKVLNWGDAGWVMFFGKTPVLTPDDLKKMKFFVWGNDTDALNLWQSAGFSPIPLEATDILTNLQTGLINCFDTTPLSALSFQWFPMAPHMTDMKWAPLVGATIITLKAWNKIPASEQPAVLKAAQEAGVRLKDEVREANEKAIEAMQERGLVVHELTPDQYDQWAKLFQGHYSDMSGTIIPADMMGLAIKYRDEYRAQQSAQ